MKRIILVVLTVGQFALAGSSVVCTGNTADNKKVLVRVVHVVGGSMISIDGQIPRYGKLSCYADDQLSWSLECTSSASALRGYFVSINADRETGKLVGKVSQASRFGTKPIARLRCARIRPS